MATGSEPVGADLLERAERAYVRGRLRWAAPSAAVVVVYVAVAAWRGGSLGTLVVGGATTAALVLWLRFRGGGAARGASVGLIAGAPLFLAPLFAESVGRLWGQLCVAGTCMPTGLVACALAGVVAIAVIVRRDDEGESPRSYWVAAGLVAAGVGCLGCVCAGVVGLVAMTGGLLAAFVPTYAFMRLRTAR